MSGLAIDPGVSTLLVVDLQARLMPAIAEAESLVRNEQRLIDAASILSLPVIVTEQNPAGLGPRLRRWSIRVPAAPPPRARSPHR